MQKNHDIVSINIKLESVVGENIIVAQTALDALQLEGGMHREQAVFIKLDGHGRQCGGANGGGQALGYPDGLFDLAIGQGAHMIRTKVAQVDDPGQR